MSSKALSESATVLRMLLPMMDLGGDSWSSPCVTTRLPRHRGATVAPAWHRRTPWTYCGRSTGSTGGWTTPGRLRQPRLGGTGKRIPAVQKESQSMPTMKSVQTAAAGAVEVVEIERPVPGPADALVRIRACGICGTDVFFLHLGGMPTGPDGGTRALHLGH